MRPRIPMRRKMRIWIITILILFIPFSVYGEDDETDGAKSWVSVDLNLFHSDTKMEVNPGIDVEIGPFNLESSERDAAVGSYYWLFGMIAKVVHTWDEDLNNMPSFARINGGLFWNLTAMKEADSLPPMPGEETTIEDPRAYAYGRLGLNLLGRVETDENANNVNFTGGITAAYAARDAFSDLFLPPPSLAFIYEYVKPYEAEAREALGVDDASFPRLRLSLLWNWSFGEKIAEDTAFFKQLALQIHYRYAKEFNQPTAWKQAGFDEYDQIDARLRYIYSIVQIKKIGIREIYVGYSSGRLIAHTLDDDRILFGIVIQ